jgi:hypothetical protein
MNDFATMFQILCTMTWCNCAQRIGTGAASIAAWLLFIFIAFSPTGNNAHAVLPALADEPSAAGTVIPPNFMLDISSEHPTAELPAYRDLYDKLPMSMPMV